MSTQLDDNPSGVGALAQSLADAWRTSGAPLFFDPRDLGRQHGVEVQFRLETDRGQFRPFLDMSYDADEESKDPLGTFGSLEDAARAAANAYYREARAWRRNPSTIIDSANPPLRGDKIGHRLLAFHDGQASALYSIGSRLVAGKAIPVDDEHLDAAIWELKKFIRKADEGQALYEARQLLEIVQNTTRRGNPRSGARGGQVRLERGDFGSFLLVDEDSGKDILVQTDWDYPGVASNLGWSPGCTCGASDGTVDCRACGVTAAQMISAAGAWLDQHIGETFEDPGYFLVENPPTDPGDFQHVELPDLVLTTGERYAVRRTHYAKAVRSAKDSFWLTGVKGSQWFCRPFLPPHEQRMQVIAMSDQSGRPMRDKMGREVIVEYVNGAIREVPRVTPLTGWRRDVARRLEHSNPGSVAETRRELMASIKGTFAGVGSLKPRQIADAANEYREALKAEGCAPPRLPAIATKRTAKGAANAAALFESSVQQEPSCRALLVRVLSLPPEYMAQGLVARDVNPQAPKLAYGDTSIETWFERDRQHVELRNAKTDKTIVEWWDDEVTEAVEDGFLDPRDYHASAYNVAVDLGLIRGETQAARRRNNPSLMIVTGNPPRDAILKGWRRFHQQDHFAGKWDEIPDIPGVPDVMFSLGKCVEIDVGNGLQELKGGAVWLACDPSSDALWIVSRVAMNLGGAQGAKVRAIVYEPPASSGKDPAKYKHDFHAPLPTLSPVGAANRCRGVMLEGGVYRVDDWIYE